MAFVLSGRCFNISIAWTVRTAPRRPPGATILWYVRPQTCAPRPVAWAEAQPQPLQAPALGRIVEGDPGELAGGGAPAPRLCAPASCQRLT